MTDQEKERIREKILSETARIRQDIARLEALTDPGTLDDLDEVSRMDAIVSKSVHDAALASYRNRVIALEYALKRLEEDPEFGYCVDCGEEIPTPRLLSMPEAGRCVNCAK